MQTATNKPKANPARSMPSDGKEPVLDTNELLDTSSETGLTSTEASHRLKKFGPNAVADTAVHPLRIALTKFWSPVPWMLEAAIVLQAVIGEFVGAAVVTGLLAFNAALGFFQEGRAQATLAALKSRLAMTAVVRRNSVWTTLPAAELVPGDIVKLSLGVVVAADMHLIEGSVLLDQSILTGESMPSEAGPGFQTYAAALVRRGEAIAEVTATGPRTKFGRTAELVHNAHVVSTQQKAVLRVVRNLAMFNGTLIVLLVTYASIHNMRIAEIVSLVLTAVLASIPVALPATFTLAAAVGARSLASQGVLPTRLSAVDEAATIDVLCADKTGTLTRGLWQLITALELIDEDHIGRTAAEIICAATDANSPHPNDVRETIREAVDSLIGKPEARRRYASSRFSFASRYIRHFFGQTGHFFEGQTGTDASFGPPLDHEPLHTG